MIISKCSKSVLFLFILFCAASCSPDDGELDFCPPTEQLCEKEFSIIEDASFFGPLTFHGYSDSGIDSTLQVRLRIESDIEAQQSVIRISDVFVEHIDTSFATSFNCFDHVDCTHGVLDFSHDNGDHVARYIGGELPMMTSHRFEYNGESVSFSGPRIQ